MLAVDANLVVTVLAVPAIGVLLAVLNNNNTNKLTAASAKNAADQRAQEAEIRAAERVAVEARQDAVAAKAEEAAGLLLARQVDSDAQAERTARLLLDAQRETIARTDEVAVRAAATAAAADGKLDALHTLANSTVTGLKLSELSGAERELVLMLEVIDLKKAGGREPTSDALAAIEATQARVSELREEIAERKRQDEVAAKQANGGGDAELQLEAASKQVDASERQIEAADKQIDVATAQGAAAKEVTKAVEATADAAGEEA